MQNDQEDIISQQDLMGKRYTCKIRTFDFIDVKKYSVLNLSKSVREPTPTSFLITWLLLKMTNIYYFILNTSRRVHTLQALTINTQNDYVMTYISNW